jgi:hypothetical protein
MSWTFIVQAIGLIVRHYGFTWTETLPICGTVALLGWLMHLWVDRIER